MEKLLIVDGNSILNRAYYGIRPLTAPDGTPTNAVYGFMNILLKYLEEENPTCLCVAFDVKAKTFRHKMYDQYKAQRKPAPEDFLAQIPVMKDVLRAMNCACIEKEGYEADDLIGTVSLLCEEKGVACRILTGDKDDLQLASDKTVVKLVVTRGGRTETTDYGAAEVAEKYGVTPAEYIEVKGLMGDPSDNIPGVKGVGEKTAFSLIQRYHSIDALYRGIEELEVSDSVRRKLREGRESAALSRTLSEIDRHVPMELDLKAFRRREPDRAALRALFVRLNFHSLLQKMNLPAETHAPTAALIRSRLRAIEAGELEALLPKEGLLPFLVDWESGPDLYFSLDGEQVFRLPRADRETLGRVFEDSALKKCGYDLKETFLRLERQGVALQGLGFDVLIAAYLAEPTRSGYALESLCVTYLGQELAEEDSHVEADGQIAMNLSADRSAETQSQLWADRTAAIARLYRFFSEKLRQDGQESLYYQVELPLTEVLASMQLKGVYVDKKALLEFGEMLAGRIADITEEIYELAGERFNIKSPMQLGDILFDKLKLPGGKRNKHGYSTNVDVLNRLVDAHPLVGKVLEYRQFTKLHSTYVEGMLPMIDPQTGRIHSNFNQTVTATGRISSAEPNLQNIPVRTELGRELRRMFVAEGENRLVDADYSQIELRVLAHISGDETMRAAFLGHTDIHTQTASQVFGVPVEAVTPVMRTRAKAVNFGIVYGIGAFSLAQDLKIPRREADAYIKGYLRHYPKVDAYMKQTVEQAREKGYVTTLMGRRRNMPELKASNRNTQAFGERVAMNTPIQGTAADIIKVAMVHVYQRLKREKLKSRLILQVHDELIVETRPEETEQVKTILREEMEQACRLDVPLTVDMNVGKSWYDTK